jgi:peptidoglycan/xylan/chitin deacetylase (PgdA/CDA1 family)
VASAAYLSGVDRILPTLAGRRREPIVLGYHRVVDDFAGEAAFSFPAMLVSRRMLESHLDWIARRFQVVSLDDLRASVESPHRSARPVAAITFDDGYRDVYEHAVPLLLKKGLPAAVFVTTNYVGTAAAHPHDELYLLLARAGERWRSFPHELCRVLNALQLPLTPSALADATRSVHGALRTLLTTLAQRDVRRVIDALAGAVGLLEAMPSGFRAMTWEMVRDMSRRGFVIGSHTKTHRLLTNEDDATIVEEIRGSQHVLARQLGRAITSFSYPDGRFDAAVVRAVAGDGYQIAVTTCRHRDGQHPWLTVPRLMLWERSTVDAGGRFSPAIMSGQIAGLFRGSACGQRHFATPTATHSYGERHTGPSRYQRTVPLF